MPSHSEMGFYGLKKLRNKCSSDLLDEFMDDLHFLIDSNCYIKLLDVYSNWEEPVPLDSEFTHEIALESKMLVIAVENLKNVPISFLSDLIDYNTFIFFLPFLEWVYSMYLGRQLNADDVRKLFASDFPEKIVFELENFDQTTVNFKTTPEFFQKLRKLKWENRKTKKIYNELDKIFTLFAFEDYGLKEMSFDLRHKWIILFLAGCAALKENRDYIIIKDVFRAYKTIFKIIGTDISKSI